MAGDPYQCVNLKLKEGFSAAALLTSGRGNFCGGGRAEGAGCPEHRGVLNSIPGC